MFSRCGIFVYACTVALSAFVVSACSSTDDDDETSKTAQAIASDWIHPACDTSALGPPLGDPLLCNGPTTFTYREWWANPDACGAPTCLAYNSCTSWDLNTETDGLGYSVETWAENGPSNRYEN